MEVGKKIFRSTKPKSFFLREEKALIINAIKKAEDLTSGEIRVHIEYNCKKDPLERGKEIFNRIGMHRTKFRNGVLIYISTFNKKFAIIGDKGIHEKVKDGFWQHLKEKISKNFLAGNCVEGLTEAILEIGEKLKLHFPRQINDANELSDEISYR